MHDGQRPTIDARTLARLRERRAEREAAFAPTTLGDLARRAAHLYDNSIAIEVFERGERASYAEVDAESNRIAAGLHALGVRAGDRVAVMLANRLVFPLIWFALAKLGGVIVPVNMRYTPREIAYVIGDAGCAFAIIDAQALDGFQAMDPWPEELVPDHVLVVGGSDGRLKGFEDFVAPYSTRAFSSDHVGPETLMNIQYTSGTTGFPKGCQLTHEYWAVFAHQAASWDESAPRRLLSAQPFFYADPQWHLLKSFSQGATLFLASQMSSSRFVGWLRQHEIEWCQFPELVARQLLPGDTAPLRLRHVVGFGWSPPSCRQFKQHCQVPARDAFAMTEIGFGTQMPYEIADMDEAGSVGLPAPLRELRVVREDGSESAPGEVGELWVRGRGLFKGYWNNREANTAAFAGGWFRTGDLFRTDVNGFCWLVGRVKDMIRRSSENIAAREVEAVIREIAGIEDAAAIPVRDPVRGEEVKVLVQLREGIAPDDVSVERILAHARARLAPFKVPRYISYVDSFPRTASNKIKKAELMTGESQSPIHDAQENA